jgi:hypothetical protein
MTEPVRPQTPAVQPEAGTALACRLPTKSCGKRPKGKTVGAISETVFRLPLGNNAPGLVHVGRQVAAFRKQVEDELVKLHGGIGVGAAKRVRTASLALRQAIRIGKILADAGEPGRPDGLTHEQWLNYSNRLLAAEELCDRSLTALGLDARQKPKDPWDEVLGQTAPGIASPAPETASHVQADGGSQGDELPEGGAQ